MGKRRHRGTQRKRKARSEGQQARNERYKERAKLQAALKWQLKILDGALVVICVLAGALILVRGRYPIAAVLPVIALVFIRPKLNARLKRHHAKRIQRLQGPR